ncbi:MAG: SDR family oxidoreductase [Alphaproteobacteria bacterium]|nr:SDR family oxidoreductase [Alphaproteobacteria bacterium]
MDLVGEGRVALVTGGARGIGFAAARLLAAEGARIVLADLDGARAEASAARLSEECGIDAIGLETDISSPNSVARMVADATGRFGKIDIFINSAAILADNTFLESTPEQWDRMLKVCLYGPMHCLYAILPGMVERGYGRVVCLASDAARLGQARLSYYAAAKAGVIALVKSVAQEVGGNGVTLNVVSPGATNTELRQQREESLRRQMGEERYARRQQSVLRLYPTRRLGEPDDAAAMIAFLASDRASWITGQVVSVNGGFAMP